MWNNLNRDHHKTAWPCQAASTNLVGAGKPDCATTTLPKEKSTCLSKGSLRRELNKFWSMHQLVSYSCLKKKLRVVSAELRQCIMKMATSIPGICCNRTFPPISSMPNHEIQSWSFSIAPGVNFALSSLLLFKELKAVKHQKLQHAGVDKAQRGKLSLPQVPGVFLIHHFSFSTAFLTHVSSNHQLLFHCHGQKLLRRI